MTPYCDASKYEPGSSSLFVTLDMRVVISRRSADHQALSEFLIHTDAINPVVVNPVPLLTKKSYSKLDINECTQFHF